MAYKFRSRINFRSFLGDPLLANTLSQVAIFPSFVSRLLLREIVSRDSIIRWTRVRFTWHLIPFLTSGNKSLSDDFTQVFILSSSRYGLLHLKMRVATKTVVIGVLIWLILKIYFKEKKKKENKNKAGFANCVT